MSKLIIDDNDQVEDLRKHYKEKYFSSRYIGWSDSFDRKFDEHSNWFSSNDCKTFCRVTYKNINTDIPIDLGKSDLRIQRSKKVCEINNFFYERPRVAIEFIKSVMSYLEGIGIEIIYCIVDSERGKAFKFNTRFFNFKPVDKTLLFPEIKYLDSGVIVKWNVLKLDIVQDRRIHMDHAHNNALE